MSQSTQLACACGKVRLEIQRAPITSAECHCNSCREAGERLGSLPGAPPVLEANGGTRFVLYRKDRVRFTSGTEMLREFRLGPDSTTRRVVASCCNTPVFLEFKGGHWLSLYRHLWPEGALPPLNLRTMLSDRPDRSAIPGDVPAGKRATAGFYAKLLGAWISMGFKSPPVPDIRGEIRA